jgi:uncharacterized RmlC-like cupin family protein
MKTSTTIFVLLTIAILAVVSNAAIDRRRVRSIRSMLQSNADKPTEVERLKKFTAEDFLIDLNDPANMEQNHAQGGNLSRMSLSTLPALAFQGIAMTLIELEPCGINTPHIHPRASEAIYTISGSNIEIGIFNENGLEFISNTVRQGHATFIPQGAIHFEQNHSCEPAVLIASNNNEDPGVLTIASGFWTLSDENLEASTGASQDTLRPIRDNIPASPGPGTEECRRRCGLLQ